MKFTQFCKEFIRSKHIQLALVSGFSIISLAFISKRVLDEPISSRLISLPALMVVAAEALLGIKKKARYTNINFWMLAIALVTVLIIVLHLI